MSKNVIPERNQKTTQARQANKFRTSRREAFQPILLSIFGAK